MKQLKLKNSELVVTLDPIDYDWAKEYEWVLVQVESGLRVYQDNCPPGHTVSLIKEIAKKVKGNFFIDRYCKVLNISKSGLDMRRGNIIVQKTFKLNDAV